MAQYDPIVVKAGVPTALGADAARADRIAVAGLTTSAPAAGDACQVSAALTLGKAVNTSTAPVVGVYDGASGSVVRSGVVVANRSGPAWASGDTVYLSSTAGALTNVKPTLDVLHEVGVVVDAATGRVLLQQKPIVVLPPSPPPYLWVPNATGSGGLTQILVADGAYVNRVQTGVKFRFALYDGTYVWGISEGDNPPYIIVKLNPVTGAQVGYYSKDRTYNDGMLMAFDGINIWYSVDNYPNVKCVDSNFNYVRGVNAGGAWPPPSDLIYDGVGNVWALSPSSVVYKIRTSDGAVLGNQNVLNAWRRSMWTDKTNVWLVSPVGGVTTTLIKIRISDLATTTYPGFAGVDPRGGFFDGANVWFVTYDSSTRLHKVRASDGVVLGSWDLGTGGTMAQCVRWDGANMWLPGINARVRKLTTADPPVNLGDFPATADQVQGPMDCAFTNIVLPYP